VHDRLRGVPGSFRQALTAIEEFARAGITPGSNTQVNRLSAPVLEETYEHIYAAGARMWQIQLTVPAGNAAEQVDLILQPWQIPETYDTLARLFERGRKAGFRLFSGNNIGYFGPYEHLWRTMTDEPAYWDGCGAAESGMAIEADGVVKGCPSLHKGEYGGGNIRDGSLTDIWLAMQASVRPNVERPAWGFCGTCYYKSVCKSGCTWTAGALLGVPGNNPMCDHRARTLRDAGLRERFEQVSAAPDEPFAQGLWRLALETLDGAPLPESAYPVSPQPRDPNGDILLCRKCGHYSFAGDDGCMKCGAPLGPSCRAATSPGRRRCARCSTGSRRSTPSMPAALPRSARAAKVLRQIDHDGLKPTQGESKMTDSTANDDPVEHRLSRRLGCPRART
jgi:radical SAM protein with 4Fe4S-binding SPASM domain